MDGMRAGRIAANLSDSAVLAVTRAESLRLEGNDERALRVICQACGMEEIDVMKRKSSSGSLDAVSEYLQMGPGVQ